MNYLLVPLVLFAMAMLPLIGRAILGPISRLAGALQAPTRFQLSDFVWLLVILQAVMGGVVQFVGVETRGPFEAILLYLVFASVAVWCGAVSFLSRAGVTEPRRRAVFTLVIMPGTLTLMIGIPVGIVLFVMWLMHHVTQFGWDAQTSDVYVNVTLFCLGLVAVPFLVWFLRRSALWVAQDGSLSQLLQPASQGEVEA